MNSGPTVIGFDGSSEAESAVREAGELLTARRALVVTVAKEGVGFDTVPSPSESREFPPATLDIRTAREIDEALSERAQRIAERGAELARAAGLDAEALAVVDELDVTVAETLVDVARGHRAPAVVVGAHQHGGILGPVTREVVRRSPCPVLVRGPSESVPAAG